jgi:enoyl-CoA hydratase/carnithine racemase
MACPRSSNCTSSGGVVRLTLCHESRRNAVSVDLLSDLDRRLEAIEADESVRPVVLTGRGRSFSVGADLAASPEQRWLRRDSVAGDCRGSGVPVGSSSDCISSPR